MTVKFAYVNKGHSTVRQSISHNSTPIFVYLYIDLSSGCSDTPDMYCHFWEGSSKCRKAVIKYKTRSISPAYTKSSDYII